MIYLVTANQELFESSEYRHISTEESIKMINSWKMIQFDTETTGTYARLDHLLSAQFGNTDKSAQVVVDCTTIDIVRYKEVLEAKYLIGQNLKFDLQFLYNYGIIPRKVYDTMIVEQFLYLGYPSGSISYSLKEIAYRRLGINIDKTVRGEIIWRGLDEKVIQYAAGDVEYLYDIMQSQLKDLSNIPNAKIGAKLECDFVPTIAYLEWCGIRLDESKWKDKMLQDEKNLDESIQALNNFVVNNPKLQQFTYVDRQGDLFTGFDLTPKVTINWSSSSQVVKIAKILGFNTTVKDKKTDKDKDSVMEKQLKGQKTVNNEFLKLYFGKGKEGDDDYFPGYSGSFKVVTSFGQGHLNAICPTTGRIHTIYKQLGASSGRMSCGSKQLNTTLAKYKHISPKECTYPNIQQLPSDDTTRACFVPNKGNLLIDCDFSALESRLGADIYNEKAMQDEFLYGSGDMHSLCAKMVFHEELKDVDVKDVKEKRPDLRKLVKPIEFSQQFGGSEYAIQSSLGCSLEEAQKFKEAYDSGFKGIAEFKKKGSKFVREHGYVLMNKYTGHRMYWHDWTYWKDVQKSYTSQFWDEYKAKHKGTGDSVEQEVKYHFKAAAKWDRMALNAPTQNTGVCILKTAATATFNWIVDNGYFNKILLCALVHDEQLIEIPKELKGTFPKLLEKIMLDSAAMFCKSVPIPAEAEVGDHWIH